MLARKGTRVRISITSAALAETTEQARIALIYVEGTETGDPIEDQGQIDYSEIVYAPNDSLEVAPDLPAEDAAWGAALAVPVLALTGMPYHDLIGTHYQQDVDLDKLFMDVAAYNERVMGPEHVCNVVDEAIKTAISKRTVAHITIPKDIQDWTSANGERSAANIAQHSGSLFAQAFPLPPQRSLQQAADILNQGAKVAILAGQGCLNGRAEVIEHPAGRLQLQLRRRRIRWRRLRRILRCERSGQCECGEDRELAHQGWDEVWVWAWTMTID